ncbi:MAG: type I restriction-modification system endonuclease [Blautia sp.]|nr:type I restriction-modification system endonuclease [Lachnoclostridium sp.]MCM1211929.1 type I restriction-modification system endonuclease [Blautia sp.]
MSNFTFLEARWSDLARLGDLAEKYVYSDPNTSIIKQGMLAEVMVKYMLAYDGIKEPEYDNTHANRIRLLKKNDLLPHEIDNTLYILRKERNNAAHNGADEGEKALNNLPLLYELCVWYMQTYGDYHYNPVEYVQPVDITISLDELEKENRELEERNQTLLVELQRIQENGKFDNARRAIAYKKAMNVKLSEAQTRELIDEQLRKVGWEADTDKLRYSKGVRPVKGRNLAIAEWPTDSMTGNGGYADYALFIGDKMVGIIEAKRKHKNVSSVLDGQCKEYARKIKAEHERYVLKQYGEYKVPFLFATNGRDYIKQYEEMSGIWFLDTRQQFHTSKALAGWPSPQGMEQDLERDTLQADKKLAATGYELLQDPNGLGLRYYQIEAVRAAEKAIAEHKNTVLLAMATGTGKTRTVLGMIYRFLSARRFKRILYLVDRTALGEQTMDTFQEVKLEDLKTLNQLYDIKDLGEKEFEKDTRVHIATVQSLVKRILYKESDVSIGVSDYDCIIVDEAHRGYILDKEMSEDEAVYRNQDDFRSKYRAVIDYFDAVKIALTATPALHTTEIFGKPIYSYDYRTAVVDGYLVDHDAPHIMKTKLSEEGIVFEAGSTAPIYDPVTNTIINSDELEDDLKFEVEDFNKKVVTESFNETVLAEIARDIDPNEKGKTLIFAVDDAHADMITRILKDYYTQQGISEEAVMKITGSIENGNPVKIKEAIRRFKNETFPNIVVTVDLLTTGIDVEEIVNLVFLRRIRSRILFEQMLGRATRLCPEIGKTHFEIYDAVGVYQALEAVSTMKPVVVNQTVTFDDLIDGMDNLESDRARQNQIEMIIAKILRNKNKMPEEFREQFQSLSGGETPESFVDALRNMPTDQAVETVKKNRAAFAYVQGIHQERPKFISNAQDELISHERGYGGVTKPEDYLKEFHNFIENNINEIAALNIVATRPKELTRQSLRELKLILDRHNFSETKLQTAWKQMTNEDIAADIISFIRQRSLGDALVSKEERIHCAIVKTKAAHPELSRVQLNWLERIEAYLIKEVVLNKESFDAPQFQIKGGYAAVDKAFGNKLDIIIDEINNHMYTA